MDLNDIDMVVSGFLERLEQELHDGNELFLELLDLSDRDLEALKEMHFLWRERYLW